MPTSIYEEPPRRLPVRRFDVVIAGAGTAGVIAATAAARQGAKTLLVESKGYPGGVAVEGGTAIHSFYNLWKAFPGIEKRQVVKGIPLEMIDRLVAKGGCCGYPEMEQGYDYDSVGTAIDTELYKLNAFEMLAEAGVTICMNTLLVGALVEKGVLQGVILESRAGREVVLASAFVDTTGYGDLAAQAGAAYSEPNDYAVANSMGLANVNIEKFYEYLRAQQAVTQLCYGPRSGKPGQIVRLGGDYEKLPEGLRQGAQEIGMTLMTTTVYDDYIMFVKLNLKLPHSPTNRDEVSQAELVLRQNMQRGLELLREYVPGFERAFIARTSPSLCIRRGRLIACDYDISHEDVVEARHFKDDVFAYGFHDFAPRIQIKNGGTYGIPYRALCVQNLANLFAAGMMITSDHRAHMSTRNTVCCMGQGQAAGTAAALCAQRDCAARELPYDLLHQALIQGGVYLEAI